MDTPTLASIPDLAARMGEIEDETRALAALDDASALIRSEAETEDWLDDDGVLEPVPPIIVMVCCKAAQRSLSNPNGLSGEQIGGYGAQFANASPDVYLTKAEKRLVRKAAGRSSIGSVELVSPYRRENIEDVYMTVQGGGDDLPMGPWPNHVE